MKDSSERFDFGALVAAINQVSKDLSAQAGRAVNISLTMRNWLIGGHIAEYELHRLDRASYGDSLLAELAARLGKLKVSNCSRRQLYRYLRFYRLYPQIVEALSPQLRKMVPSGMNASEKVGTVSPQLQIPPEQLVQQLSYSHLELIVDLDDDLKRAFYTIESIRGNWSVRELKRQINKLSGIPFDRHGQQPVRLQV